MSKVIYTALFGDYEELKEPTVITLGWRYICLTDQPLKSEVWEIVPTKVMPPGTEQLTARWYKLMGFVDYERSIWVDAAFQVHVNLDEFWQKYYLGGISAPQHPHRDCVHNEIFAVIESGRADKGKMLAIEKDYKDRGVKGNVVSSGILLRENTPEVIRFCEEWWRVLIAQGVNRDQVAAPDVPGYSEIVRPFRFNYTQSTEIQYFKHKKYR